MKKLIIILPVFFLLFNLQVFANETNEIDIDGESSAYLTVKKTISLDRINISPYKTESASLEKTVEKEAGAAQADKEAKQTAILLSGVIIFLGVMFIVRRNIRKSLKDKKLN